MFKWFFNLFAWLTPTRAEQLPAVQKTLEDLLGRPLEQFLTGATPGSWASNHFEESFKCNGWTYAAAHALSCQIAQSMVEVGEFRGDKQPKPVPYSHPIRELINNPNPIHDKFVFFYLIGLQLRLTGQAKIWVVRDSFNAISELYVIPTGLATPMNVSSEFPFGAYRVQPLSQFGFVDSYGFGTGAVAMLAGGCIIDARAIHTIRWPHPVYMNDSLSPLAAGALAIDVAEQINRGRWYALKQSTLLGLILKIAAEQNIGETQRRELEKLIQQKFQGTINAGRVMVLPPGIDKVADRTPAELDFTQAYPQARDEVLATHQSPPIAIGVTEAGNYSALYASLLQYCELTVQPHLDLIAGGLMAIFQTTYQEIVITMKARRVDDPQVKDAERKTVIASRAMTVNEYREKYLGLPKVEWGEIPVGSAPPAATKEPTDGDKTDPEPKTVY